MPSQTRKGSAIEAVANVTIGFIINWSANMVILPLFGFDGLTSVTAFEIGLAFTAVSVARSYILRRTFNLFSGRT